MKAYALLLGAIMACSRSESARSSASSVASALGTALLPSAARVAPAADLVRPDDGKTAYDVAVRAAAGLSLHSPEAEDDFRRLTKFCAGHAGLAYLAWDRGDVSTAQEHWRLARQTRDPYYCVVVDSSDLGVQILSALRHSLDQIGHDNDAPEVPLPCAVFERHAQEAFAASAPYWGSTRDLPAIDVELECARRSIRQSEPADRVSSLLEAFDTALGLATKLVHEPSGTLWISAGYSEKQPVAELMIAPEATNPEPDCGPRLARAARDARRHVSRFAERFADYQMARRRLVAILAPAVCDIAARRAHAMPTERCTELTKLAIDHSIVDWLESEPWKAFYMEGAP
jgi:hypothetical protein